MKQYAKRKFPVSEIRRFLEPGPIVLLSTRWKGRTNIMTMGWQTVMEFSPSLIGCMVTARNYSFELLRRSKECVINIPTADMAEKVIGIGNTTGAKIDKFAEFHLTPLPAKLVAAPLIKECHTNIECRLADSRLVKRYNFFILQAVRAQSAISPRYPRTLHYRGQGIFMISGRQVNYRRLFKPETL